MPNCRTHIWACPGSDPHSRGVRQSRGHKSNFGASLGISQGGGAKVAVISRHQRRATPTLPLSAKHLAVEFMPAQEEAEGRKRVSSYSITNRSSNVIVGTRFKAARIGKHQI